MTDGFSFLIIGMLAMHLAAAILLGGFWLRNQSTVGLSAITLSPIASFVGLVLAFGFGEATSFLQVLGIYVFLVLGHAAAWVGLADFWHQKTKRQMLLVVVLGIATVFAILFYQAGGGVPVGRTALVSIFFAISSFSVVLVIFRAKGFRIDIYESAIRESRLGSYFVMGLFILHGLANLYRIFSWPELGLDTLFSGDEVTWFTPLTVLEALMFTPLYVTGVIMMVAERLQTELRVEQMLEPVTRSLNRRAFLTVAKVVLARARRNADAVSILLIEVANIKDIRDAVGRTGCDKVLKQLSTAVVAGRREQDIFSRFSNDEFLLILPGTPEEGATLLEDRVKGEILGRSYHQKGKDVTVRVKLASYTARGDDLEAEGMIDAVAKTLAQNSQQTA